MFLSVPHVLFLIVCPASSKRPCMLFGFLYFPFRTLLTHFDFLYFAYFTQLYHTVYGRCRRNFIYFLCHLTHYLFSWTWVLLFFLLCTPFLQAHIHYICDIFSFFFPELISSYRKILTHSPFRFLVCIYCVSTLLILYFRLLLKFFCYFSYFSYLKNN